MKTLRLRSYAFVVALAGATSAAAQSTIPDRLSDYDFWKLVNDVSEPGGYFRSDNFLSNELGFQYPIPELKRTTKPGGVYLGVGPEQNFTYIVALQPKMAVIFDIRRQNMIEHLMYKALIETSPDRATFLAKLFSRKRPDGLDTASTVTALFNAYVEAPVDSAAYRSNLAAIKDRLARVHGFALSSADSSGLDYVYSAFFEAGVLLNYSFRPGSGAIAAGRGTITVNNVVVGAGGTTQVYRISGFGRGMATYSELQTATDGAGNYLAYLGSEANYRWLRDMETRNMLVPVVGNFAGPKAIRAVGDYLRAHNATVTAFYLSNVEQYLFQQADDWKNWFENVATLPLDPSSTFIRSGRGGTATGVTGLASLLASMQEQVKAFKEGKIQTYWDVISTSH
jgi:hypothetical protein